jgi:prepilin-type N-terminal cleavage/methylation domain-containing protein
MSRRAFTLIEVIVALFLLAVMSTLALEAYRGGVAMWDRSRRDDSSLETARALLRAFRLQVRSAAAWNYHKETSEKPLYFRGDQTSMEFTSLIGLTSRRGAGFLRALHYSLESAEEGKFIRVAEYSWPRRGFPDGDEKALAAEDVPGIEDFRLSYEISSEKTLVAGSLPPDPAAPVESRDRRTVDRWPSEARPEKNERLDAVTVTLTMRTGDGGTETLTTTVPVRTPVRDMAR